MYLILPYPPSVNHYWRHNKGKFYISDAGKAFRKSVWAVVCQSRERKTLIGPLRVSVSFYPPDFRKRDIDNPGKALLDALQHAGVYGDDSQIVWLLLERRVPDSENPRVEVTVTEQTDLETL